MRSIPKILKFSTLVIGLFLIIFFYLFSIVRGDKIDNKGFIGIPIKKCFYSWCIRDNPSRSYHSEVLVDNLLFPDKNISSIISEVNPVYWIILFGLLFYLLNKILLSKCKQDLSFIWMLLPNVIFFFYLIFYWCRFYDLSIYQSAVYLLEVLKHIGLILVIFAQLYGLGSLVIKRLKIQSFFYPFYSIAIGLALLGSILSLINFIGFFTAKIAIAIFAISSLSLFGVFKQLRNSLTKKYEPNFYLTILPLIIISIIITVPVLMKTLRPIPIEYDATTYYILQIQSIITGTAQRLYLDFWSLTLAYISKLTNNNLSYAFVLNLSFLYLTSFAVVGLIGFYSRSKDILVNRKLWALGAMFFLWISTPMNAYLVSIEDKKEFYCLFFLVCSIMVLLDYRSLSKNYLVWLLLLFAFFALISKPTLLYFYLALVVGISITMEISKKSLVTIYFLLLICLGSFLIIRVNSERFYMLSSLVMPFSQNQIAIIKDFKGQLGGPDMELRKEFANWDFSRFENNSASWLSRLINLPISLVRGDKTRHPLTDIGFIWSVILLLFLVFFRGLKVESSDKLFYNSVLLSLVTFYILWVFGLRSVVWYGLPVLIFLSWMLLELIINKMTFKLIRLSFVLWVVIALAYHNTYIPFIIDFRLTGLNVQYAAGMTDFNGYLFGLRTGLLKEKNIIQELRKVVPDCRNNGEKIYNIVISHGMHFYPEMISCFFTDRQMIWISKIAQENNFETQKIYDFLRKNGFRTLVVSSKPYQFPSDYNNQEVNKYLTRLDESMKDKQKLIFSSSNIELYDLSGNNMQNSSYQENWEHSSNF